MKARSKELLDRAVAATVAAIEIVTPGDYDRLTEECRKRYKDFKATQKYHDARKPLLKDKRFGEIRFLDPGNPKSSKKPFFNPNILQELDKHFTKK